MIDICNLERFATHDGEGIRSVVFFQGCPLRCPWCANPESQIIAQHLLYNEKLCSHCHTCEQHCPTTAIQFKESSFSWDASNCIYCHACEESCVQEALHFCGEQRSVDDIMSEVLKDKAYYETSNGGITISGGEPFVQFDNLMELLKRCKQEKLHVTIETCGQYPLSQLIEAYSYIDTFYFDIKHIDESIYNSTVKGNLKQVQENMQYLVKKDPTRVVFRVPVIPDFNYHFDTLTSIIDMAKLYAIKEVHLLPYHLLGKGKYDKMMRSYTWSTTSIKEEELLPYQTYANQIGVPIKIGG